MNYDALTSDQISSALSFCCPEDRQTWYQMGMAIKSELGEGGKDIWLQWSSLGSTYNLKDALSVWRGLGINGGIRIGTLMFEAIKNGYKHDNNAPKISKAVQEQRKQTRLKLEKQAEQEELTKLELARKQARKAQEIWRTAKPCEDHPYLTKKDIMAHGCRVATWTYKDDKKQMVRAENTLIIPLYYRGVLVSVQGVTPDKIYKDGKLTDKFYLYGAKKSGVYALIGEPTDTILICEGFATGATLHEATQLQVYVALDATNLSNVATEVRKMLPLSRIIICADNDQYKKVNTGITAAEKAAAKVDADVIYPIFHDTSTKPTDFNDLYKQEGYSPITAMLQKQQLYKAKVKKVQSFDAFKLRTIENASELLETSASPLTVANAALTMGLRMAEQVPAFVSIEQLRKFLDHPLISHDTHRSIMCRLLWSIHNRKRRALTSIKPVSWRKHDFTVVDSLDECPLNAPVNVVFAPMGSGKTKNVIKPFSESCDKFVAIAHRRSLIADLADRLGITSYDAVSSYEKAINSDKLAICLPSTKAGIYKGFLDSVNNVAIDEISQNIRFTQSKECKVSGCNQEDVFFKLKELVNEADKLVVCDASIDQTTIDFLESARPDEKFNIIAQVPKNIGRTCYTYTERADFLTKIELELRNGGKVWLAVESADRAEILNQMFSENYETLVITSKNSKNKKIKEFLNNIDEQSRKYDLVIASPAISSGVSVEHQTPKLDEHGNQEYDEKGKPLFVCVPHFTMIAGMASGHSICFSDFAQMLGRVRYVKDYHVCLQKNNQKYDGVTTSSILTGLRQAAALEGISLKENDFSLFSAHIEVVEKEYRADFANGLIWFLEYFCFAIEAGRVADVNYILAEQMKSLSADMKEKYRLEIKAAKKINKEEAKILDAKQSLSDDEEKELLAFKIRVSFNMDLTHDIEDLDIDMFENMSKVDRFARLLGLMHDKDDSELNITLRRFEKAQVQSCAEIFEGVDLNRITKESCDLIVSRVATNDKRFLYSALKLIPSMYGKWQEDNKGNLKQYPVPSITTKSVAAILDKFGLGWSRRNGTEGNFYAVKEDDYVVMKRYAEMRYS